MASPAGAGTLDRVALGTLHAGLFAWVFVPGVSAVGPLLLVGAALNLWRLLRWRGGRTIGEPLLFILHIGYGWMVLGVALLGWAALDPDTPQTAAIHALTVGAIGTMTLGVMTRATRGHTGHALSADRLTTLIFALVSGAAVLRIGAGIASAWSLPLLVMSASFWTAAFGGFVLGYAPMLLGPDR